jgi:hypothetical protein
LVFRWHQLLFPYNEFSFLMSFVLGGLELIELRSRFDQEKLVRMHRPLELVVKQLHQHWIHQSSISCLLVFAELLFLQLWLALRLLLVPHL